ncbi:hypothetical protein VTN49DRAFT_2337 [Thermomyces lanuginosus]|uniref:uncharacterized protein n=1 Tax=Thermomyces lanuginosus TaxID=5541 RepID=UPI0037444602
MLNPSNLDQRLKDKSPAVPTEALSLLAQRRSKSIDRSRVITNTATIFSNHLNSAHHPFNGRRRSSARGGASDCLVNP